MSLIELLRKQVMNKTFEMDSFKNSWPVWREGIFKDIDVNQITGADIVAIANRLKEIFNLTSPEGRGQSSVATGGHGWEGLICWYLNLCTIGSNTVFIKHQKENIPESILDATTVKYGSVSSNTESDILAITFPKDNGRDLYKYDEAPSKTKLVALLNNVVVENFSETCLTIIQCKTNWKDNAQIPMLWDLIYQSTGFNTNASVGQNGFTIKGLKLFSYAFVTVPTGPLEAITGREKYLPHNIHVLRVGKLSGGNYWGLPTKPNVASNVFDMIHKNFPETFAGGATNWNSDIASSIKHLVDTDDYFQISK
jgi:hypothetical protein